MKYPFDIEKAMEWMGACQPSCSRSTLPARRRLTDTHRRLRRSPTHSSPGVAADLVLVFFDPMGQALCKRTLDIVGTLPLLAWDDCTRPPRLLTSASLHMRLESLHSHDNINQQKINFFLSKADTIENDKVCVQMPRPFEGRAGRQSRRLIPRLPTPLQDRQKVIVQITQNLCRRQAVNSVAFEIPTIFIPRDDDVRTLGAWRLPPAVAWIWTTVPDDARR